SRFARDKRIKDLLEAGFKTSSKGKMIAEPTVYHKNILPSANLDHDEDPIADLIHTSHKKSTTQKAPRDTPSAKPLGNSKPLPTYVWIKGVAHSEKPTTHIAKK